MESVPLEWIPAEWIQGAMGIDSHPGLPASVVESFQAAGPSKDRAIRQFIARVLLIGFFDYHSSFN